MNRIFINTCVLRFEYIFVADVLCYVSFSNTCIKKDNSKLTYKLYFILVTALYTGEGLVTTNLFWLYVSVKPLVSKYKIPVKSAYM